APNNRTRMSKSGDLAFPNCIHGFRCVPCHRSRMTFNNPSCSWTTELWPVLCVSAETDYAENKDRQGELFHPHPPMRDPGSRTKRVTCSPLLELAELCFVDV